MRLQVSKPDFMKSWQTTERVTSTKSTISSLAGILCRAHTTSLTLEATDLKTSIKCNAAGVQIEEEGEAILPVKVVGELFKKAPTDTFTVSVEDGKGIIFAGRNTYRFSTFAVEEFPHLPTSDNGRPFCTVTAGMLSQILSEGTVASTLGEEFPKYLGAALIQLKAEDLRVVSTDGRRLSLSKSSIVGENISSGKEETDNNGKEILLPLAGLKELLRQLSSLEEDHPIHILYDDSLAYFQMGDMEFSVRKIESSFPNYEKILNPQSTTTLKIDRNNFINALERVDVVVRDYSRMVILKLSPNGDLRMIGRAPEIGEAEEILDAQIDGEPLLIAFNVGYLLDGLKAMYGEQVYMTFNGPEGQMSMLRPGVNDFLYMLMPIKLNESDIASETNPS